MSLASDFVAFDVPLEPLENHDIRLFCLGSALTFLGAMAGGKDGHKEVILKRRVGPCLTSKTLANNVKILHF